MEFKKFFESDERRVQVSEVLDALEEASGEKFSFVKGNFDNEKENIFQSESGRRFLIEKSNIEFSALEIWKAKVTVIAVLNRIVERLEYEPLRQPTGLINSQFFPSKKNIKNMEEIVAGCITTLFFAWFLWPSQKPYGGVKSLKELEQLLEDAKLLKELRKKK